MKTRIQLLWLAAWISVSTVPPLRAQLVPDGATATLVNVTNTITGAVTVGTNGSFTLLTLANNALLTNSGNGVIGLNLTARSNEVQLTSPTARWRMGGTLYVGSNGVANRLVVSNGALVENNNDGAIGNRVDSSNNVALVTGGGSMWSTRFDLRVGSQGRGNQLIVSNGGWVVSRSGFVGNNASASHNFALVTGSGSVWSNALNVGVGLNGSSNQLVIEAGGLVHGDTGTVGDFGSASNNEALVTGPGSLWTNRSLLTIGSQGSRNRLVVSNGASVWNGTGVMGNSSFTSNNHMIVTGAGSVWNNQNDLTVGNVGGGNRLQVDNGATVSSSNVFVGFHPASLDNRVIVDGGTLRANVIDMRRGFSNFLNAGVIEAGRLLVTNNSGRFTFTGGTLAVGSITIGNGLSFGVGDGISPATLNLTGDGTHSFSSILTIRANAMLMGNGTILAPVSVQSGSTLSPGTAPGNIGRLASSDSVPLGGTSIMEISKRGSVLTNDQLQVANTLTYLGALIVTNLGPDALTAGDRFQLFPAGSYASFQATFSLPPLNPGLGWINNLLVDGSIEVKSLAPSVQTLPPSALTQTSATLNGVADPKGTSTSAWFEFGFTTNYGNVTPLQALGGANGDTNFSEALTGLIPAVGYHFRAVASNSFGVAFGADQRFPSFAQRDYIKASNTGSADNFGIAVAMDGNTLVVGALFEASNATGVNGNQANNSLGGAGAVYVFVRNGESWIQQAYLKASNPGQNDFFGASVAVSGDTLVVGAEFEASNATGVNGDQSNNTGTNSGAAYVFVRNGTNWSQQAYLKASNTDVNDRFGASVALSGDTIVVGAKGEASSATGVNGNQNDNSAPNSGAAYVFVRNGTTWSQQAYLKPGGPPVEAAFFGLPVAVSGNTVVLGVAGENSLSGAAYVFVRNGTTWSQQAHLTAGNAGASDFFGISVAVSGDTVVVGAREEDSNATGVNGDGGNNSAAQSGAAYVFARSGTTWTQQAYLKASNTGGSDFFGSSVAVSDDTVVVGVPQEDSNATGVNGDGSNNSATQSGAAYVFARSGSAWSFQDYLKASNTDSNDFFGSSVAVSGDTIVVGANGEASSAIGVNGDQNNNGSFQAGAAYVYGPPRPPAPEINVLQSGTNILNGGSSQQYVVAGTNTQSRNFTINNTGNGFLTSLTITIDGADAARFTVTANPVAPLTPTSNTTFTVRFAPTSPETNIATLHIASNDEDENPFNIQLSGLSLSFTEDRDGDGLNDASELLMASLGFNFQATQTSLVNTLFNNLSGATSNLNAAGFFTQTQLQALNVDTPLLAKDPFTGLFKLTIGVKKATDLTNFFPFPMTAPQTIINAEGKLEFQFSSPDNAAFFRLEAR